MKEKIQGINPLYENIRLLLKEVECPKGCDKKNVIVNLKEYGANIFVYCNTCGTIIFDSRKVKEELAEKEIENAPFRLDDLYDQLT